MTVIAHATDLSGNDQLAFVHACALAAASGARLVTIHGNHGRVSDARMPDAAPWAVRWGREIVQQRLVQDGCEDLADGVLDALRGITPDLLIVGTHARHGIGSLLHGSLAEALARNLEIPTLIVPNTGRGFVDAATGAIDLGRLLVPASEPGIAEHGLAAVRWLATLANTAGELEVVLVHAGEPIPPVSAPGLRVWSIAMPGSAEAVIANAIRDHDPRLVVMPTHGHDGAIDLLFGSYTEHVVRQSVCPVLSVPLRPRA
jgi:nucleotide-binding universal stress UspA family protein